MSEIKGDERIRKMTFDDLPNILALERKCKLSLWGLENYKIEITKIDSVCLVVEEEKIIKGFAVARLITSASEAEILNIGVNIEDRRRNLGKILLQEIISTAKKHGLRTIWLEVRKSNLSAQKFYQNSDFEFAGCRKNYYTNPSEDALIMKLCL